MGLDPFERFEHPSDVAISLNLAASVARLFNVTKKHHTSSLAAVDRFGFPAATVAA
ncbi:hypothetical protein [Rhodobacter sp. TJ_12]|uniref:hypothetical protein n=1 Tax=Rhodobacter sp. TJ_12 TaxID=2029399 RepID=UPI001CBE491B|nr:hypothetical protein [Rhodobacter sp. TJ_12]